MRPTYEPSSKLVGECAELNNATVLEFWKWAFGDLCDDDIKGFFAEWMVLKLLGISSARRISWANSDIITLSGVRIEIKASSYWQSWKLLDEFGVERKTPIHPPSKNKHPIFSGLKARNAVDVPESGSVRAFKSDIYVFAFQKELNPELWNALDLSQWEFYALPAKRLKELNTNSVSLRRLRSEQEPLTAIEFIAIAQKLIAEARTQ